MIKARALVLIDYNIEEGGGFRAAAEEQEKLEIAISQLITGNKRVEHYQIDMKERRGASAPDLKKMKFRSN